VAIASAAPPVRKPCQVPHHSKKFFTGRMPFLPLNQQCQSTEGRSVWKHAYQSVSTFYIYTFQNKFIIRPHRMLAVQRWAYCYWYPWSVCICWTLTKLCWLMLVWDVDSGGPQEPCIRWQSRSLQEGAFFEGQGCPPPCGAAFCQAELNKVLSCRHT